MMPTRFATNNKQKLDQKKDERSDEKTNASHDDDVSVEFAY